MVEFVQQPIGNRNAVFRRIFRTQDFQLEQNRKAVTRTPQ